jgi:phosphomannomutase/phosphoglucomutase
MEINPLIFREYDIRGVVGKDLTDKTAFLIGKAFGTYLRKRDLKKVAVGRDCRLSSDNLFANLAEGLSKSGCNVIDIGVVPTPLLYYALFNLEVEGGVMITGSHNPPDFNGFKLCVGKETIYGAEIQNVLKIIQNNELIDEEGKIEVYPNIIDEYKNYILSKNKLGARKPKVVIDAGNGTASIVAPDLLTKLGAIVIPLYCEMDGNFPNHHPDPTIPDNLVDLINKVKETNADIGIGYDGDADRIGIVDELGNIIWGDKLLLIYARDLLSKKPKSKIIYEVKCSMLLEQDIKKHNGIPIMWKAGHSLIKGKMKETSASLAGEMSGHVFFADEYFGYDDAIYASCRILRIISETNKKVSELLGDLAQTYSTPEIRIDCPDEIKFEVISNLQKYFIQNGYKTITVDGVRVEFEDGWGLVRASNTQPALVLRFEAYTKSRLDEIKNFIMSTVEKMKLKEE